MNRVRESYPSLLTKASTNCLVRLLRLELPLAFAIQSPFQSLVLTLQSNMGYRLLIKRPELDLWGCFCRIREKTSSIF